MKLFKTLCIVLCICLLTTIFFACKKDEAVDTSALESSVELKKETVDTKPPRTTETTEPETTTVDINNVDDGWTPGWN